MLKKKAANCIQLKTNAVSAFSVCLKEKSKHTLFVNIAVACASQDQDLDPFEETKVVAHMLMIFLHRKCLKSVRFAVRACPIERIRCVH